MGNKWEYVLVRDRNRKDRPVPFDHPHEPAHPCPTCGHVATKNNTVNCGNAYINERGRVRAIELRCNGKRFSKVPLPSGGTEGADITLHFR